MKREKIDIVYCVSVMKKDIDRVLLEQKKCQFEIAQ